MALDAVKALCLESPGGGGTQLDPVPTEVDPRSDALSAAGLFVNGGTTTPDKSVLLDRSGTSMRLGDAATTRFLAELVCSVQGGVNAHQSLADIIHFLPYGPGDGWASGAVCVTTWTGLVVSGRTWYTSASQAQKIFAVAYGYTGLLRSSATYTLYGPTGALVRQLVDTIAYSGLTPTQTTRTWS